MENKFEINISIIDNLYKKSVAVTIFLIDTTTLSFLKHLLHPKEAASGRFCGCFFTLFTHTTITAVLFSLEILPGSPLSRRLSTSLLKPANLFLIQSGFEVLPVYRQTPVRVPVENHVFQQLCLHAVQPLRHLHILPCVLTFLAFPMCNPDVSFSLLHPFFS